MYVQGDRYTQSQTETSAAAGTSRANTQTHARYSPVVTAVYKSKPFLGYMIKTHQIILDELIRAASVTLFQFDLRTPPSLFRFKQNNRVVLDTTGRQNLSRNGSWKQWKIIK